MNMNAPRRRIVEDALDLYSPTCAAPAGNQLVELPISKIRPYHDHPFRLYSGDRLNDMVESVKKSGILVPVIVQPMEEGFYEMLAGHNRMQAASLAGLDVIPAIVKEGLTPTEALYYVVETNVLQRSFSELLPTEQAAVIQIHYSCIIGQGKRNDIDRELKLLAGLEEEKQDEDAPVKNSRAALARQYSLSSTKIARLLKLNDLLPEFKARLDSDKLPFIAAVEISYLSADEQASLLHVLNGYKVKLDNSSASMLHQLSKKEGLTEDRIRRLLLSWDREKEKHRQFKNMKVPKAVFQKYFSDVPEEQVGKIVTEALELYFKDRPVEA